MTKLLKLKILGFTTFLLAIVSAIGTSTYAWFSVGRVTTVDPYTINVSARGDLLIAPGIVTDPNSNAFSTTLDFGDISSFGKTEISGNGLVFYKPTDALNNQFTSTIDPASDYIAKDFTFLFDKPKDIYLSSQSIIVDSVGSLSPAARMAFYEYVAGEYQLKFVWAPNTTQPVNQIKYISDANGGTSNITNAVVTGLPIMTHTDTTPIGTPGMVLTINTTPNVPVLKSFRIVIWADGADPESNGTALSNESNAIWRASLNFVALSTI